MLEEVEDHTAKNYVATSAHPAYLKDHQTHHQVCTCPFQEERSLEQSLNELSLARECRELLVVHSSFSVRTPQVYQSNLQKQQQQHRYCFLHYIGT